jgi:hypothetical protein
MLTPTNVSYIKDIRYKLQNGALVGVTWGFHFSRPVQIYTELMWLNEQEYS